MKRKVYMRFARDPRGRYPCKVDASVSPRARPLEGASGQQLHTVHFALELDIPDELLSPAKWPVVEVSLDETPVRIPIEVEASAP